MTLDDTLTAIDEVTEVCTQCGKHRGGSPSDNFCSEPCQRRWMRTCSSEPEKVLGFSLDQEREVEAFRAMGDHLDMAMRAWNQHMLERVIPAWRESVRGFQEGLRGPSETFVEFDTVSVELCRGRRGDASAAGTSVAAGTERRAAAGAVRQARSVVTTTTAYRLDLPRWDVGPRVPYRTKTGKTRTRMHRPVWDALTGNARTGHWSQRSKAVAEVIQAVMWIAKAAKVPAGSHLSVRVVWAPGDHRRADPDLLDPLRKVMIDALARGPRKDLPGLRLVPDDTSEWVTRLPSRIDRPPVPAGLWLEIEVRP